MGLWCGFCSSWTYSHPLSGDGDDFVLVDVPDVALCGAIQGLADALTISSYLFLVTALFDVAEFVINHNYRAVGAKYYAVGALVLGVGLNSPLGSGNLCFGDDSALVKYNVVGVVPRGGFGVGENLL